MERGFATMSPQDAFQWFLTPVPAIVTMTGTGAVLVVSANPARVALIMDSAAQIFVSTNPADAANNQGIQVSSGRPIFQLLQSETGSLCQQAWYANGGVSSTLYVFEVVLRDWPGGLDDARQQAPGPH